MTNKERKELAHWVAGQCTRQGADDAAVNISFGREIEAKYQDRKLDKLTESTSNSLNLNVYQGGRYSSHSTSDLRRDSLSKFVEDAVAMTKYLAPDPDRSITDAKYYGELSPVDLKKYDPGYESVTSAQRVEFAKACEEAALEASDKVITCAGNYYDGSYESVKVHSNGFEGDSRSTFYQAYADVTLQGDNDVRIDDYYVGVGRFHKKLPNPTDIGRLAVERAWRKNGQKKIASGLYTMVVENRVVSNLLGPLASSMNGQQIYRKNSFLVDKIGQPIASELLTATDEPLIVSGLGSQKYDNDGMPCKPRVLIEKGVLKSYLIDYFWSRKLQTEPTGGETTNIIYSYGDQSLDELIAEVEHGILVRSFVGGNYNGTTGEFSYGVIGEQIEGGKLVQAVNEMNVSGNYNDLWMRLVKVGNDPYENSSNRRPSMVFNEVQFAGV